MRRLLFPTCDLRAFGSADHYSMEQRSRLMDDMAQTRQATQVTT